MPPGFFCAAQPASAHLTTPHLAPHDTNQPQSSGKVKWRITVECERHAADGAQRPRVFRSFDALFGAYPAEMHSLLKQISQIWAADDTTSPAAAPAPGAQAGAQKQGATEEGPQPQPATAAATNHAAELQVRLGT